MLGNEFVLEPESLCFVVLHFFIPEVIEVVHFLLMGFVDLLDFVLVSDFHFVYPSEVKLLFEFLGSDSVGFCFDVVGCLLVMGHGSEGLVEFCFELLCIFGVGGHYGICFSFGRLILIY
jgi:hypothetical protein